MHLSPSDIQGMYIYRTRPEYNQALNLAAQVLGASGGRVLALLSAPIFATELYKRCPFLLEFSGGQAFGDMAQFIHFSKGWAWGGVSEASIDALPATTYKSFFWAEPELESATEVARRLRQVAVPGARLVVIASSFLRRFLPEWSQSAEPLSANPVSPRKVLQLLTSAGWHIERQVGFHGPRAVFLGVLYRVALQAGRLDWADRCLFASRAAYQETGWLVNYAPVVLIQAR